MFLPWACGRSRERQQRPWAITSVPLEAEKPDFFSLGGKNKNGSPEQSRELAGNSSTARPNSHTPPSNWCHKIHERRECGTWREWSTDLQSVISHFTVIGSLKCFVPMPWYCKREMSLTQLPYWHNVSLNWETENRDDEEKQEENETRYANNLNLNWIWKHWGYNGSFVLYLQIMRIKINTFMYWKSN